MHIVQQPDGTFRAPRAIEPFEVSTLAICFLYGVLCMVAFDRLAATSLQRYPGAGGYIFVTLLAAGGLVGLAGVFMRSLFGVRLELAALNELVAMCLVYLVWTPFSVGLRGTALMLFMGVMIGAPALWVSVRLRRFIKDAEKVLPPPE